MSLLVVLSVIATAVGSVPTLDAARAATAEWRAESELNVWLGLDTHHEGWHVDDLAAHTNVTLADQHASVVDGLSEPALEDEGLQTTLHDVLDLKLEHVIQTLLVLIEDSVSDHATHERLTLEDTLRVLLILGQERTRSGADLGESQTHTPDLTLVLKTELSNELKLGVQTLLLVRTTRGLGYFIEIPQLTTSHVPLAKDSGSPC